MSLRDSRDLIVEALNTLLAVQVPEYVDDELTVTPPTTNVTCLERLYQFPVPVALVPQLRHPCLIVYRDNTVWRDWTMKKKYRQSLIRVDYICQPVPADKLEETWPLLTRVFEACVRSITEDSITVNGLVLTPLTTAGVVELEEDAGLAVQYAYVTDEGRGNVYPFFTSAFSFVHVPRVPGPSAAELAVYRGMTAKYLIRDPEDINHVNDVEIVHQDIINAPFSRAFDASFASPGDP